MTTRPEWQYDEMKHCGVDYSDLAQVEVYDKRHQRFRDYEQESQTMIDRLGLGANDTVIDLGCGTGAFTLCAAKHVKKIYAVDISQAMLGYCEQKAQKAGLDNIEFCQGGFLTYEHSGEPVEAIISVAALHHLPDFWKMIALRRLAAMLKDNGKLYLFDVVFSFDIANYKACLDEWVKSTADKVGSEFAAEAQTHVREEYSTFGWIMEGLLEKAGFKIEKNDYTHDLLTTYLCTKTSKAEK